MRPVRRGVSPQRSDFSNYVDAKPELVSRLGSYCSYCERRVNTNLAVEHIQPKGLAASKALIGTWSNFLLACVNCNATKKDKPVVLANLFLPDRDNTSAAFVYSEDGKIALSSTLTLPVDQDRASDLLALVGLDKKISELTDANDKQIALDRVSQRMEVWGIASMFKDQIVREPNNNALRDCVVQLALAHGFFSVWMTVFLGDIDMRKRFIEAFPGTAESGCFDPTTTNLVFPAPNRDHLRDGSKL
ncbi:HNH endonuclease [Undibacterium luofuense]|uniref:HNH endonuclease n=1 Tax=Undibacterium luofuense TaxID=2828733 RepID=A0A941I6L6_9BURK|nr:HNH endonuclease [Undibacterium luofuense]MBR7784032.1 HNH endonuclease [Undibacterium luofuense]